jgi:hypothetical protein
MDDILNSVKDVVGGEMEEKIEAMAEPIAEKIPEGIVDGAEDMINRATGIDLDLNGNEASAEGTEPAVAAE